MNNLTLILSKQLYNSKDISESKNKDSNSISDIRPRYPSYGHRKGFIPKTIEDYENGGAFPEIPIEQYPLNMGRDTDTNTSKILIPTILSSGKIDYSAIARLGHDKQRLVQSTFKDMIPKSISSEESFAKPNDDQAKKTTEETRAALESIVQRRIQSTKKSIQLTSKNAAFIKYIPSNQIQVSNPGSERIIKMVEEQIDPLEPSKFKHKKIPRPPPSPPAPVLHSPPRKATIEEQKAWAIPPSISNWKNSKGYTIPLDKRLASDGRGLQEIVLNEKFALFSEALYIAESHARTEIEARNALEQKLAEKEREKKEQALRTLAQQSRQERVMLMKEMKSQSDEILEREKLRIERSKERERSQRLSKMGTERKQFYLNRQQERDIGEKIALGVAQPTLTKETMFDQRLFNQTAGLSSGFSADDSYHIYDKPLFEGSSANIMYRPTKRTIDEYQDKDTTSELKFKGENRNGPVLFERGDTINKSSVDADLDAFFKEVKTVKRK